MDLNNRPDSIEDVLAPLHPGQWFTFHSPTTGKDREHVHANLRVLDDQYEKPTSAWLNAELSRLQAEFDGQDYARKRAAEYPSWQEQFDMLGKDQIDGGTRFRDARQAVKAKYPE